MALSVVSRANIVKYTSRALQLFHSLVVTLVWPLRLKPCVFSSPQFHAMVLSCKSPSLAGLLGPSASRHLALLTRQLLNCLADHRLLQTQGSLLALGLLTLELE